MRYFNSFSLFLPFSANTITPVCLSSTFPLLRSTSFVRYCPLLLQGSEVPAYIFANLSVPIGPISILREITGLHYEEAVRLRQNPDWFDGNFIHLPEWAQQKAKRKQRERWVRLSIPGKYVMREFFSITVPSRIAFDK